MSAGKEVLFQETRRRYWPLLLLALLGMVVGLLVEGSLGWLVTATMGIFGISILWQVLWPIQISLSVDTLCIRRLGLEQRVPLMDVVSVKKAASFKSAARGTLSERLRGSRWALVIRTKDNRKLVLDADFGQPIDGVVTELTRLLES